MKPIVLLIFLLISFSFAIAQRSDSVDYINHIGTIYPVKDKITLGNGEFKHLIGENREAMKYLKKARTLRGFEIGLELLAIIPLTAAIVAETPEQFWFGIAGAGLLTGIGAVAFSDSYNKNMLKAINLYNEGLKNNSPTP